MQLNFIPPVETKQCSKCRSIKPTTMFSVDRGQRDGLFRWCKECSRRNVSDRWHSDPNARSSHRVARKTQNASWQRRINAIKSATSCQICGEREAVALDLHHLDPSIKAFNISELRKQATWSRVESELMKCIVICSNCHRKHHAGMLHVDHIHPITKQQIDEAINAITKYTLLQE